MAIVSIDSEQASYVQADLIHVEHTLFCHSGCCSLSFPMLHLILTNGSILSEAKILSAYLFYLKACCVDIHKFGG